MQEKNKRWNKYQERDSEENIERHEESKMNDDQPISMQQRKSHITNNGMVDKTMIWKPQ